MAHIKSGNLVLDSSAEIKLGSITINKDDATGFLTIHASGYYHGNGASLSGIVFDFKDLNDVPVSYLSYDGNYLMVNSSGDAIEFSSSVTGSGINSYTIDQVNTMSGTLQAQIDLLGGLAASGSIDRSGIENISDGADNISVVFDNPLSSSDYTILFSISNTVDATPSIFSCVVNDKDANGFSIYLSGDTDSSNYKLEWAVVSSEHQQHSSGGTGIFIGGYSPDSNIIDYITISTTGNALDFGDLTLARGLSGATSNGINDRGVIAGSQQKTNIIDYVTISTPGNAIDFGDLTVGRGYLGATSNNTNDRGIFVSGNTSGAEDAIDYITIPTIGNATDFGNLTVTRFTLGATSNTTNERGVFGGGYNDNTIDYVTISTLGNALDFGDLLSNFYYGAATSNGINNRGIFGGGFGDTNVIQYITISTPGNATDFGGLTSIRNGLSATSNTMNERGIFGGGAAKNIIDYITISTPGNAVDFGDFTLARPYPSATSNS